MIQPDLVESGTRLRGGLAFGKEEKGRRADDDVQIAKSLGGFWLDARGSGNTTLASHGRAMPLKKGEMTPTEKAVAREAQAELVRNVSTVCICRD